MRRTVPFVSTLLLAGALAPAAAHAAIMDGVPDQASMDGTNGPSSMSGGSWSDLMNGVQARPYLKRLSIVNGGTSTLVFSGGPGNTGPTGAGKVTAVVSPVNLCAPGTPPSQGNCYATPNRVGIQFGYIDNSGQIHRDFSNPSVPLTPAVTADTALDVVIGLSTIGSSVRWTAASGVLEGWKTSGLGTSNGEIHIQLRPARTPEIDWSTVTTGNGCTATPIRDCEIAQANGESLSSNMTLSLDETLNSGLTGAVFATQRAIMGFLQPSGSGDSPALDFQLASSHLRADGEQQLGTLQAFLPAAGLTSLYDLSPSAAAGALSAERRGDPGTSTAPTFTVRDDDDNWNSGLSISIGSITFSAPTYRVTRAGSGGGAVGNQGPAGSTGTAAGSKGAAPTPSAKPASKPADDGTAKVGSATRKGGIAVKITGATPGKATGVLLVRGKPVAKASVTVGKTGSATLRIKPSGKLRGVKKATLRLTLPGGKAPKNLPVTLK